MKKVAAFLALALASVALVACGGDDDNGTTTTQTSEGAANGAATGGAAAGGGKAAAGGETISLEADPDGQLAYTTDTLTAKAGNLTIDFSNPARDHPRRRRSRTPAATTLASIRPDRPGHHRPSSL